jgi:mannose-6-phosphate isomerase-like protein (cupin superfamily)
MEHFRRVVTATNDQGKSYFVFDGIAQNAKEMTGMNGLFLTDLWETVGPRASNKDEADAATRPVRLEPPDGGTILRIVEFPPDKNWRGKGDVSEAFTSIAAGHAPVADHGDPMMHITKAVDYIIVLKGEIYAVMDEGETLLKAGDILIQRGTNHSWHNRSDSPCIIAAVLVSADPLSSGVVRG